jgi:hypothetical protein
MRIADGHLVRNQMAEHRVVKKSSAVNIYREKFEQDVVCRTYLNLSHICICIM